MKRIVAVFIAVGALLFFNPLPVTAAENSMTGVHSIGDFKYEIINGNVGDETSARIVSLADDFSSSGPVVIPDSVVIAGMRLPVVAIGGQEDDFSDGYTPVFLNLPGIVSVRISSNIREIGREEFFGCTGIEGYSVASGNPHFTAINGLLIETAPEGNILFRYPSANRETGWTIPQYIASVAEGAFAANYYLKTLFLSSFVRLTPCWQNGNSTITNIDARQSDIYDSERSVEGFVYERITVGDAEGYRLVCCAPGISWHTVSLPDNVMSISEGSFCYSAVRNWVFGSKIDSIPPRAFENSLVETVEMPGLTNGIGSNAFYNCQNLKSITLAGVSTGEEIFQIGARAFKNCIGIERVFVGKTIARISIGAEAFKGCESLQTFKFTTVPVKFSSVGTRAFQNCRLFHSFPVNFIQSFEKDATDVFAGSGLMTMVWTPDVANVPEGCFRDCYRLKQIDFTSRTLRIGKDAFRSSAVTEFDSENIKWIATGAFYDTPDLSLVYIPDNTPGLQISDRFGMKNQDFKLIVDNKQLSDVVNRPDSSAYSNATLYISALESGLPSSEWKKIYVPWSAEENYRKYCADIEELFSLSVESHVGVIKADTHLEDVKITGIKIGGIEGVKDRIKENVWCAPDPLEEGTEADVEVEYTVYGKQMTTRYESFFIVDSSKQILLEDDLADVVATIEKIGVGKYKIVGADFWTLYDSRGNIVKNGDGNVLNLSSQSDGFFILKLHVKDCRKRDGIFKILN